jgi:hypothetical protein
MQPAAWYISWDDMSTNCQTSWKELGWTRTIWDDDLTPPPSDYKDWDELTDNERSAAESLGYTQQKWD